jgi:hypothetical protein
VKLVKTIGDAIAQLRVLVAEGTALYSEAVSIASRSDVLVDLSSGSDRDAMVAARDGAIDRAARVAIINRANQHSLAQLEAQAAVYGLDWTGYQSQ